MSAVTHSISEVERQLRVDEERLDSLENLKKVSSCGEIAHDCTADKMLTRRKNRALLLGVCLIDLVCLSACEVGHVWRQKMIHT